MKKYLVLGLKKSGLSAINFLQFLKKEVIGFDDNLNLENLNHLKNIIFLNDFNEINFNEIKTIIISPGVSNNHKIIKEAKKHNIEIISEIELGFRYLKNKVIAVTGTNGKTTLTSLITHVLNENNINAVSLGNIGNPLTAYLLNPKDEIIVLELSSFQLENIFSKKIDIAVITNIEEDHLDRYDSFSDYACAKLNILKLLKDKSKVYTTKKVQEEYKLENLIICEDDLKDFAKKVLENFNADFELGFKTFKNLEHRLELFYNENNVKIYNDSKSTNLSSTIYALKKIEKCDILILGGYDKGFSFKILNKYITNNVKHIIAIGDSRFKILKDLKNKVEIIDNFDIAINRAVMLLKKGDTLLFSPATSSFDWFKNYEDRGKKFKEKVSQILKGDKKLWQEEM
jgi:UDP-N-acetylmuramoylalanine--D-glutamate ligase